MVKWLLSPVQHMDWAVPMLWLGQKPMLLMLAGLLGMASRSLSKTVNRQYNREKSELQIVPQSDPS